MSFPTLQSRDSWPGRWCSWVSLCLCQSVPQTHNKLQLGSDQKEFCRCPQPRAPPTALSTCPCHAQGCFSKPVQLSLTGRTLALEGAPGVFASPGRSLTGRASQPRFCWKQAPVAPSASWRRPPSFN